MRLAAMKGIATPAGVAASKKRMIEANPMRTPATRQKVSATLKRLGYRPKVQGGNGRPLSKPHAILAERLTGWAVDYPMQKESRGHYLIDLAHLQAKIAVEVDGRSHAASTVQKRDREKDALLVSRGWLVLRVLNEEVLADPDKVHLFIISQLRARGLM